MSKKTLTSLPDYRLEVINGYMRPLYAGMDQALNRLMLYFLVPLPARAVGLVEEIEPVERGEADEWAFESPETRITCNPEFLLLKDVQEEHQGSYAVRIEMSIKESKLLLKSWLFEGVWREQQGRRN